MVICQSECHTGGTLRDPPDISLQTLRFLNPCLPFQIPIHQLKEWSNRWDATPPHRALNAFASTVQPAKATFQFSVAPFSLPSGRGHFLYYGHGTGLLRLESPGSCPLAGGHPDGSTPVHTERVATLPWLRTADLHLLVRRWERGSGGRGILGGCCNGIRNRQDPPT